MKLSKTGRLAWLLQQAAVWLLFLLGLYLIVLRSLGAHLQNIPGDLAERSFGGRTGQWHPSGPKLRLSIPPMRVAGQSLHPR